MDWNPRLWVARRLGQRPGIVEKTGSRDKERSLVVFQVDNEEKAM
jgi:hypothetical protein